MSQYHSNDDGWGAEDDASNNQQTTNNTSRGAGQYQVPPPLHHRTVVLPPPHLGNIPSVPTPAVVAAPPPLPVSNNRYSSPTQASAAGGGRFVIPPPPIPRRPPQQQQQTPHLEMARMPTIPPTMTPPPQQHMLAPAPQHQQQPMPVVPAPFQQPSSGCNHHQQQQYAHNPAASLAVPTQFQQQSQQHYHQQPHFAPSSAGIMLPPPLAAVPQQHQHPQLPPTSPPPPSTTALPKDSAWNYRAAIRQLYQGYLHTHWHMAGGVGSSSGGSLSSTASTPQQQQQQTIDAHHHLPQRIDVLTNLVAQGMPRLEDIARVETHRIKKLVAAAAQQQQQQQQQGATSGPAPAPAVVVSDADKDTLRVLENILLTLGEARTAAAGNDGTNNNTRNNSTSDGSQSATAIRVAKRLAFITALCREFSLDASAGGTPLSNNNSTTTTATSATNRAATNTTIRGGMLLSGLVDDYDDYDDGEDNDVAPADGVTPLFPPPPPPPTIAKLTKAYPRLFPDVFLFEELTTVVGLGTAILEGVEAVVAKGGGGVSAPTSNNSIVAPSTQTTTASSSATSSAAAAPPTTTSMTPSATKSVLTQALWQVIRLLAHAVGWLSVVGGNRTLDATKLDRVEQERLLGSALAQAEAMANRAMLMGNHNNAHSTTTTTPVEQLMKTIEARLKAMNTQCVGAIYRASLLLVDVQQGGGVNGISSASLSSPADSAASSNNAATTSTTTDVLLTSLGCASHLLQPCAAATNWSIAQLTTLFGVLIDGSHWGCDDNDESEGPTTSTAYNSITTTQRLFAHNPLACVLQHIYGGSGGGSSFVGGVSITGGGAAMMSRRNVKKTVFGLLRKAASSANANIVNATMTPPLLLLALASGGSAAPALACVKGASNAMTSAHPLIAILAHTLQEAIEHRSNDGGGNDGNGTAPDNTSQLAASISASLRRVGVGMFTTSSKTTTSTVSRPYGSLLLSLADSLLVFTPSTATSTSGAHHSHHLALLRLKIATYKLERSALAVMGHAAGLTPLQQTINQQQQQGGGKSAADYTALLSTLAQWQQEWFAAQRELASFNNTNITSTSSSTDTSLVERIASFAFTDAPYYGHTLASATAGMSVGAGGSAPPPNTLAAFLAKAQSLLKAIDERVRVLTAAGNNTATSSNATNRQQHVHFYSQAKATVLSFVADADIASSGKLPSMVTRLSALAKFVSLFVRQQQQHQTSPSAASAGSSSSLIVTLLNTASGINGADAQLLALLGNPTALAAPFSGCNSSKSVGTINNNNSHPTTGLLTFAKPLSTNGDACSPADYLRCQTHLHIATALESVLVNRKVTKEERVVGGGDRDDGEGIIGGGDQIASACALLTPSEVCVLLLEHLGAALGFAQHTAPSTVATNSSNQQHSAKTNKGGVANTNAAPSDRVLETRVRLTRAMVLLNLTRFMGASATATSSGTSRGRGGGIDVTTSSFANTTKGGEALIPSTVLLPSATGGHQLRSAFESANKSLIDRLTTTTNDDGGATLTTDNDVMRKLMLTSIGAKLLSSTSTSTGGGGASSPYYSPSSPNDPHLLTTINDALAADMQWLETVGLQLGSTSGAMGATSDASAATLGSSRGLLDALSVVGGVLGAGEGPAVGGVVGRKRPRDDPAADGKHHSSPSALSYHNDPLSRSCATTASFALVKGAYVLGTSGDYLTTMALMRGVIVAVGGGAGVGVGSSTTPSSSSYPSTTFTPILAEAYRLLSMAMHHDEQSKLDHDGLIVTANGGNDSSTSVLLPTTAAEAARMAVALANAAGLQRSQLQSLSWAMVGMGLADGRSAHGGDPNAAITSTVWAGARSRYDQQVRSLLLMPSSGGSSVGGLGGATMGQLTGPSAVGSGVLSAGGSGAIPTMAIALDRIAVTLPRIGVDY